MNIGIRRGQLWQPVVFACISATAPAHSIQSCSTRRSKTIEDTTKRGFGHATRCDESLSAIDDLSCMQRCEHLLRHITCVNNNKQIYCHRELNLVKLSWIWITGSDATPSHIWIFSHLETFQLNLCCTQSFEMIVKIAIQLHWLCVASAFENASRFCGLRCTQRKKYVNKMNGSEYLRAYHGTLFPSGIFCSVHNSMDPLPSNTSLLNIKITNGFYRFVLQKQSKWLNNEQSMVCVRLWRRPDIRSLDVIHTCSKSKFFHKSNGSNYTLNIACGCANHAPSNEEHQPRLHNNLRKRHGSNCFLRFVGESCAWV